MKCSFCGTQKRLAWYDLRFGKWFFDLMAIYNCKCKFIEFKLILMVGNDPLEKKLKM